MTSAQVVETSVTNNSSFQNYTHPDDHTIRTTMLLCRYVASVDQAYVLVDMGYYHEKILWSNNNNNIMMAMLL